MSRRSSRRSGGRSRISVRVIRAAERNKAPAAPPEPFRPSLNAVMLLAVILVGALWTWLYSDWFSVFSSTIGLTAILGVLPAMRGYMSPERNKQWGAWIDHILFQSTLAARVYPILLALIVIVGFGLYQPVTIHSADTAAPGAITLSLHRASTAQPQITRIEVDPGNTHRQPVRRSMIGGPARAVIKAPDAPQLERDLRGLFWPVVRYPFDFWATPAVLLYPAPSVLGDLRDKTHHLEVTLTRGSVTDQPCTVQKDYLGQPVWLGTGGHALPVSDATVGGWRDQATLYAYRNDPPDLAARVVTTPLSPPCLHSLVAGDTIAWRMLGSDGTYLHMGRFTVAANETYPIEAAMEAAE